MPGYELFILLRTMPKKEIVSTLKRTAETIFDKGGIIRKLENLGTKPIPYKTSSHGLVHKQASYFLFEFNAAPATLSDINEVCGRDIDIIRRRIFKCPDPNESVEPCTLHEEKQPPAYRKDVQDLIEIGKRKQKKKFQYNTGLDYYPFQK